MNLEAELHPYRTLYGPFSSDCALPWPRLRLYLAFSSGSNERFSFAYTCLDHDSTCLGFLSYYGIEIEQRVYLTSSFLHRFALGCSPPPALSFIPLWIWGSLWGIKLFSLYLHQGTWHTSLANGWAIVCKTVISGLANVIGHQKALQLVNVKRGLISLSLNKGKLVKAFCPVWIIILSCRMPWFTELCSRLMQRPCVIEFQIGM